MIKKISLLALVLLTGSAYAATSHHHYHKTSCKDLSLFREKGLQLTSQEKTELASCEVNTNTKANQSRPVQVRTWSGYGVVVERYSDGLVYVDEKPAALDETTEKAKVYSQGLNKVVIYNNGKANLIVNGVVRGWLK